MSTLMKHNLSKEFCETFILFPQIDNESVELYLCEESDLSVLNYITATLDITITTTLIDKKEVLDKITQYFQTNLSFTQHDALPAQKNSAIENSKIVKQINSIITKCILSRASDIHFEPYEKKMICRARVDGILINQGDIVKEQIPEILSRIKIMAGLDIAEKRRPQDGRIRFAFHNRVIDIRVSFIPTDFGEKAVLRILDKESLKLELNSLGFTLSQLSLFEEKITSPNGIILVTGPTGSGKTTTLYAALHALKSESLNISTVEDPIEYNLEGINQTQVKPEIDLTFSKMLRSLLRQDPNILMVGEIRDNETLEISIRAALTGHLVLSTLHTNNAVATISRLIDMGGEPALLASTIKLIIAQRLVRLNCQHCITNGLDENEMIIAQKMQLKLSNSVKHSVGCDKCNKTGYYGRKAIYELLHISDALKEGIHTNRTEIELKKIAQSENYTDMIQSSEIIINNGLTTPSEVLREISI